MRLGYRLVPDMLNFTSQVQIAADHAKRASARLAGVEPPAYEDNEASFAELKARIEKTVAFINTLKPAQFEGAESREITLKIAGNNKTLSGQTTFAQRTRIFFSHHDRVCHSASLLR